MRFKISYIVIFGAILRLIFVLFVAEKFWGREGMDLFWDNDTPAWSLMFENLIRYGELTCSRATEYGYFGRMPFYPFFLGVFYLITGDWLKTYQTVAYFQIVLDVLAIYLVYKTALRVFASHRIAITAATLYAGYPFIIVWNPIAYTESISIFFLILSLFLLVRTEQTNLSIFAAGLSLAMAALNRPQLLLFMPFMFVFLFVAHKRQLPALIKPFAVLTLGILLGYGWWPVRNYVFHKKIVLTQDLRGLYPNWDVDVIAYMRYNFAVQENWEPTFSEVLKGKHVELPAIAYWNPTDSLLLNRTIHLAQYNGNGFSHWPGYHGNQLGDSTSVIAENFAKLRENFIRENLIHYWVVLPFRNLRKSLFKIQLTDNDSLVRKLASIFFMYRSLLLVLGLAGSFLLIKRASDPRSIAFGALIAGFFIALYLALSFGTGPQFRNIEMRYLLPADVLMLFPAAYLVNSLLQKFKVHRA